MIFESEFAPTITPPEQASYFVGQIGTFKT